MNLRGTVLLGAMLSLFISSAHALRVKEHQVILDQLSDYETCQNHDEEGDWCHDALVRWVKDHPADAFKAGKMTRLKMNAWAAIPFFASGFDAKNCKDEDVKLAVLSALDLPAESPGDVVTSAKKIGLETCYKDMKTAIADAASPGSNTFKNACKVLSAKGDITGLKKKKCDTL